MRVTGARWVRLRSRQAAVLAVGLATVVAIVDMALGERVVLLAPLVLAPLLGALYLSPLATAGIAAYVIALAIALGIPNGIWSTADHRVRSGVVVLCALFSIAVAADRRRREAALANAEEVVQLSRQLELAVKAGRLGMWSWDMDSGRVSWDDGLCALFGIEPGSFPGTFEAWTDLLHPEDREQVLASVDAGVQANGTFTVEHRCIWPDGSVHWLEGKGEPLRNDAGEVVGATGVTVDATERAGREQAGLERRRLLDRLLDSMPALQAAGINEVRRVACEVGRLVFDAEAVSFWTIENDMVRLVARVPETEVMPLGTVFSLDDFPRVREGLRSMEPGYAAIDDPTTDPAEREVLVRTGGHASARVPLLGPHGSEALLTFAWNKDGGGARRNDEVFRRLADQVALALHQAERRQLEVDANELSTRLQAGLLPSLHLGTDLVRVVAVYRPGEHRLLLGGDFYDAVRDDQDSVSFLVGDVAGHGAEAAAVALALRIGWRAMALAGGEVGSWMPAFEDLLASHGPSSELFVTACAGRIDVAAGTAEVVLAGHPAPLVLTDRVAVPDLPVGPPIGIGGHWHPAALDLGPRWALFAYTDGLIEGRVDPRSSARLGVDGLVPRLLGLGEPASLDRKGIEGLLTSVTASNGGPLADDVAVLLLAAPPEDRRR